jgi:hypothetical protein
MLGGKELVGGEVPKSPHFILGKHPTAFCIVQQNAQVEEQRCRKKPLRYKHHRQAEGMSLCGEW